MSRNTPSVLFLAALALTLVAGSEDRSTDNLESRFGDRLPPRLTADMFRHISHGTITTAKAYFASAKQYENRDREHTKHMGSLIQQILDGAEKQVDFVASQRGFFWRGYQSRLVDEPTLYSIYVPHLYDTSKKWPLIVSLHGGSSNHNVWMAMLLGNNLSVPEYRPNFRTLFRAIVNQDEAIIVAPQGLGQNHWMGDAQQDVLDVIEDVRANYNIDDDRIFLNGLSNGAVASYRIGLDHAWRFAAVLPMSGIVDWVAHASGSRSDPAERQVLRNESSLTIAENAFNTHFIFYHGVRDPGFDVSQARSFANKLNKLGIPHIYNEIPHLGHGLTHLLWRDMRILKFVRTYTRPSQVPEVRVVTTSERAGRQFWVVLEDRRDHLNPGRIRAKIGPPDEVQVETKNVARFTLLLSEAPVEGRVRVRVNGQPVALGTYSAMDRITLNLTTNGSGAETWEPWDGRDKNQKRRNLSGPLGDLAWEAQVHVYGTQVDEDTETLRNAAILGARGWGRDPEFTQVRHPVVPDTALTPALLRDRALVLYGNARNNAVLKEIGDSLPITVGEDFIAVRDERYTRPGVGTRFICQNPLNPNRYLVVQAGVSAEAVERAGNLPVFLPDYVVFDEHFRDRSQRVVFGQHQAVEMGYFTEEWQLPLPPTPPEPTSVSE